VMYFTPTSSISNLSLHDALPISNLELIFSVSGVKITTPRTLLMNGALARANLCDLVLAWYLLGQSSSTEIGQTMTTTKLNPTNRSEEHTSELQSRENLVCRLLLE